MSEDEARIVCGMKTICCLEHQKAARSRRDRAGRKVKVEHNMGVLDKNVTWADRISSSIDGTPMDMQRRRRYEGE